MAGPGWSKLKLTQTTRTYTLSSGSLSPIDSQLNLQPDEMLWELF
jgi:hypothetical protein